MTKEEFEQLYNFYKKRIDMQDEYKWQEFFMIAQTNKVPFKWVRAVESDLVNEGVLPFKIGESDLIFSRILNDNSVVSFIQNRILSMLKQHIGHERLEYLEEEYLNNMEKQG